MRAAVYQHVGLVDLVHSGQRRHVNHDAGFNLRLSLRAMTWPRAATLMSLHNATGQLDDVVH
jgi:hypothetical protein